MFYLQYILWKQVLMQFHWTTGTLLLVYKVIFQTFTLSNGLSCKKILINSLIDQNKTVLHVCI